MPHARLAVFAGSKEEEAHQKDGKACEECERVKSRFAWRIQSNQHRLIRNFKTKFRLRHSAINLPQFFGFH